MLEPLRFKFWSPLKMYENTFGETIIPRKIRIFKVQTFNKVGKSQKGSFIFLLLFGAKKDKASNQFSKTLK
jgi:hypothetical protein